MKKNKTIFQLFVICCFMSLRGFSQSYDPNAVTKELDKYVKNPESFYLEQKEAKSRLYNYHIILDSVTEVIETLKTENTSLKTEIGTIKSSNYRMAAESINNDMSANSGSVINVKSTKGIEYRVQIGIFSDNSIVSAFKNAGNLTSTPINSVSNAYEFTGFKNPDLAYKVSQDLRKIGINGAFVTKYVNGVRDRSYDYLNRKSGYSIVSEPTEPVKSSKIKIGSTDPSHQRGSTKFNFSQEEMRKMKESGI